MASVRVHHASSRSRSVFSCVDGDSNRGRSEAYCSHNRNHKTLNKVEALKTLAKGRGSEMSRVKGCGDRGNYGSRTSSRSNSWSSGSEREPGEISSIERGEEFIDFHGEVKKPQDAREYLWDAEIEASKRKYSWNNGRDGGQRAPISMDDEFEPGQIQESPEEGKSLRNISASCWDDADDDLQSPNPKRAKLSSKPGKRASLSPSLKIISDHIVKVLSDNSVKVSPDNSSKISFESSAMFSANKVENSFLSPRIKARSHLSAKPSYDTSVRNCFDVNCKILSSANHSSNAMEGESLIAKSPELYTEEMPAVNIAASRWADDVYFDSPDLKRSRVSPDFGYSERQQQISNTSANNSAGETLSPENHDQVRQRLSGSGVSSEYSDSDGSHHGCETLWNGEIGVSDDEHNLKIVDTDDRHDLKVEASDEEKDQMDLDGDADQTCLYPNKALPSDSDSPVLSPVAVAVRRIDMMQGCRSVDEFERLNKINEGTYGIVYRARNKKTGEIVALKKVKMEREREGFPMSALREINVLLSLRHSSVVNVKEVVVNDKLDNIFMVMEYMEHDLKDFIGMMKHPFSTSEVKCLMLQLLQGVNYLHENWVLHRDLKTSNLLINNKGELKVCDFGLARQYGSPLKTYTSLVVTLWYRAPELLLGAKKYSTAVDMWSVGCIMAELLAKEPLFSGKSEIDQLDKIFRTLGTPNQKIWPGFVNLPGAKCRFVKQPYNKLREKFPAASFTGKTTLSESGFDLLNRLLTYDPDKRITAEEALNHDWFKEVPLAKSKEFMPTYPTRSDHDRQSRRLRKSPDPLAQLKKESQQESVSDESSRVHFKTSNSIGRTVLKCSGISCTAQAGLSDQVSTERCWQPGHGSKLQSNVENWDLKTSNLLINNKGELKICDFGLARQYGSPLKTYTNLVVTLWYRAPELLLGATKYSTSVDMWSVGCIMAELLAKEPLFSGKGEIDQLDKIFRILGTPNQNIWPDFVNLPGAKCRYVKQPYKLREKFSAASFTSRTTLSESGFDLLNRLLTYDPDKRITAEEALNHDWFKEVPLAKSKEFMPKYPTRSDHDRQSRRLQKSPDPLAQLKTETEQGDLAIDGLFG